MFDPIVYDDGTVDYPYCDVCGRVLHDGEDTLPDKGTDGQFHWCSTEHTAEFMAGVAAWHEFEAELTERRQQESFKRLKALVPEIVEEYLQRRGSA